MTKKSWNSNLRKANKAKNDEFYTQLSDIEKELWHYKEHFKWKTIFCNCDDPEESNFFKYFALNFNHLWLKKLIATHYETEKPSYKLEISRWLDLNNDWKINLSDTTKTPLKQNWDFRSPECIELLKESDIIITNPPFSLFREYVSQLFEYEKKFVIIWNNNAITYKEIFKIIKENKIWLWYNANKTMEFRLSDDYEKWSRIDETWKKYWIVPAISWYTNLEISKRHEDLILYKNYNEKEYQKYDNYDAINVDRVKDIPVDYNLLMWIPITFLNTYNPEQFEIIWIDRELVFEKTWKVSRFHINWNEIYARVVIKNKKINSQKS